MKTEEMKQVGVIVFGAGMNAQAWTEQAKREGYVVLLEGRFASLWRLK